MNGHDHIANMRKILARASSSGIVALIIFGGFSILVYSAFLFHFHYSMKSMGALYYIALAFEWIWLLSLWIGIRAVHRMVSGWSIKPKQEKKAIMRKIAFGIFLVLIAQAIFSILSRGYRGWFFFGNPIASWQGLLIFLREDLLEIPFISIDIQSAVFLLWLLIIYLGILGVKKSRQKLKSEFHVSTLLGMFLKYLVAISGALLLLLNWMVMHAFDNWVAG